MVCLGAEELFFFLVVVDHCWLAELLLDGMVWMDGWARKGRRGNIWPWWLADRVASRPLAEAAAELSEWQLTGCLSQPSMTMKCGVFLYDSACLSVPLVTMKSGRAAAPCHIWYVVGGYKQLNRSTPVLRNNSTKNCCWLAADRMHACPCPPYYILVLWPVVGIHRVYIPAGNALLAVRWW